MRLASIRSTTIVEEGLLSAIVLGNLIRLRGALEHLPAEVKSNKDVNDLIKFASNNGTQTLDKVDDWWEALGLVFKLKPDAVIDIRRKAIDEAGDWIKHVLGIYGDAPDPDSMYRRKSTKKAGSNRDMAHPVAAGTQNAEIKKVIKPTIRFVGWLFAAGNTYERATSRPSSFSRTKKRPR